MQELATVSRRGFRDPATPQPKASHLIVSEGLRMSSRFRIVSNVLQIFRPVRKAPPA